MAVKIKLKRLGKIRSPHYRIVVADSRTRRDGRAIEEIGLYHPVQNPSRIEVDSDSLPAEPDALQELRHRVVVAAEQWAEACIAERHIS